MRIAQLAALIERIPPKRYGGIERFVHYLTEELVRRGHNVTLFATADSETKGNLVSSAPHPLREMYVADTAAFSLLNVARAYKSAGKFDIIHNQLDYYALPTAALSHTPTVTTLHGPINLENKHIYEEYKDQNFVSISNAQRKGANHLNWLANIYHGIPVNKFPFGPKPKDFLLYVGRISLEKGTHIAMDVAMALNKKLIIAAKLDKADVDYFNQYVAPRLYNENITWIGEVGDRERNKLMSDAICLLHPVTWPEPFGLTMVEAMACGCPVIAFREGSIPEVVQNNKTGFVVEKEKEMVHAVEKIKSISRKYCRAYVEKKFNLKKMADHYEKLYYEIVDGKKHSSTKQESRKSRSPIPARSRLQNYP